MSYRSVFGAATHLRASSLSGIQWIIVVDPSSQALLMRRACHAKYFAYGLEADIFLSQRWAERKRKILIIVPASLRK